MKVNKSLASLFCALFVAMGLQSCSDQKTYAELKQDEEDAIKSFMDKRGYTVISEKEFLQKDSTTAPNEYVELAQSGVFMNVMQRGNGEVLTDGNYVISCRYVEIAIQNRENLGMVSGDTLLQNMHISSLDYSTLLIEPENITVKKNADTFTGAFTTRSMLYQKYGSTAVPGGWLIPLRYLKVGRTSKASEVARVRLIVPHTEGPQGNNNSPAQYVYPLFYEITYNL